MREIELLAPKLETNPKMYKGVDITQFDFPQLCTFWHDGRKHVAILNKEWERGNDYYKINHAIRRAEDTELSGVAGSNNLLALLETWDVEFVSGKILIY